MTDAERDPHASLALVERAVELAGCRAIVQGDRAWAESAAQGNVFRIGPAPHDRLFPRCSAIVHHGGAGTTQMACRAGRPSVVVAHMVDQGWWGARLTRLGVAPPHLTRRGLAPEALARAIRIATSTAAMRTRAEELGQRMSGEDGGAGAVELIESLGEARPAR